MLNEYKNTCDVGVENKMLNGYRSSKCDDDNEK